MAPQRTGGSSSSGSSSYVCSGFLVDNDSVYHTAIAYFVEYCLFFFVTLALLIFACVVRKGSARLVGLLIAVLSFMAL